MILPKRDNTQEDISVSTNVDFVIRINILIILNFLKGLSLRDIVFSLGSCVGGRLLNMN